MSTFHTYVITKKHHVSSNKSNLTTEDYRSIKSDPAAIVAPAPTISKLITTVESSRESTAQATLTLMGQDDLSPSQARRDHTPPTRMRTLRTATNDDHASRTTKNYPRVTTGRRRAKARDWIIRLRAMLISPHTRPVKYPYKSCVT